MSKLFTFRTFGLTLAVGVLFASLGFANEFNINSNGDQPGQQDISSGEAFVDSCNDNVAVNIQGEYVDGEGYLVDEVEIDANPTCDGDDVEVVLTTGAADANDLPGDQLGDPEQDVLNGQGDATLDFSDQDLLVADVTDVHVLIDGEAASILP